MKRKFFSVFLALSLGLPVVAVIGLSGCAGSQNERSTGEYIDDKAVTARVNSALGDSPEYKFSEVKVTSYRGMVQLSGFVNTADQKQRAAEIARQVQGVKKVENNITLKEKAN